MSIRQGYKITEIGELPEEWEIVRLCNERYFSILSSGIDYFADTKDYLSTKSIEHDGIVGVECEITFDKRPSRANMQPLLNSVWFAKMKNTVKIYCFTDSNQDETKKFILSTGFCGILCKEGIGPNYLKQIFLWDYFNRTKNKLASGSTQQAVNNEGVQSILIPLPPPSEQRKIVSILSTIDEAIQKTDEVIAKAEELKRGLMQRLLTRGIGHTQFKQTEIGEIPEEWEVSRLEDVLLLCQYGLSVPLFETGTRPIFRMNNFENGYVIPNDIKYASIDDATFNQFKLNKGDILFNRTNSYDLVGKVGIFLIDGDYTFASYLIRLRTDPSKADPFFVNYYMNVESSQNRLRSLATRGSSQSNINATNLKSILILLPSLPEQHKIASMISSVDEKLAQERKRKEQLEDLKKGLMQVLLTGKVRVA